MRASSSPAARARVKTRRLSMLEDWSSFLLKSKLPGITLFPGENRSHCGLHTFLAVDDLPAFSCLERQ